MKKERPAAPPPKPRQVDQQKAISLIFQAEKGGQLTPQMAYLKSQIPELVFDRWGQPLPLSTVKQERLDRMMGVFMDPVARTIALLHSGTLDTIEADAVRFGHPDVYAQLKTTLIAEMADAGPPLPQWSEAALGIFFGRDAALVYTDGKEAEKPDQGGSAYPGKAPPPTPADLSGEEQLRRST